MVEEYTFDSFCRRTMVRTVGESRQSRRDRPERSAFRIAGHAADAGLWLWISDLRNRRATAERKSSHTICIALCISDE
jgi:hypothetical protein